MLHTEKRKITPAKESNGFYSPIMSLPNEMMDTCHIQPGEWIHFAGNDLAAPTNIHLTPTAVPTPTSMTITANDGTNPGGGERRHRKVLVHKFYKPFLHDPAWVIWTWDDETKMWWGDIALNQ